MTTSRCRIPALCVAALAAAGCGRSAVSRFYTLDATALPAAARLERDAVIVGPVTIPASVDRPEFVVQVAPNRVEIDELNRWASPLGDAMARTVAGDLAILLGSPHVATAPMANFQADYRVTIDVQRFESVPGEEVAIDAVWVVRRGSDGLTRSGRTTAREQMPDASYDALAAGHSRALATLSGDIADAIHAVDGEPRAATRAPAVRARRPGS